MTETVNLIGRFTLLTVLQQQWKLTEVVLILVSCMHGKSRRTPDNHQTIVYSHCSAVTINVAGNLKVAVSILVSWLLFRNPMTALNVLGCAITVGGCTIYGYVTHLVKVSLLIFLWGFVPRMCFSQYSSVVAYISIRVLLVAFPLYNDALQSCGSANGVFGAPLMYL